LSTKDDIYSTTLLKRRWLAKHTIEITLAKPPSFEYESGQWIRLIHNDLERDYSLVSMPGDPELCLCIRVFQGGGLSSELGESPIGTPLGFIGPGGYFTFKPSARPVIFVATGTGVAPFCSMIRSGAIGVTLLHGVRSAAELYYKSIFQSAAKHYVPCLSENGESMDEYFRGRVTDYLKTHLAPGRYDFYLCGRREMVRDATFLVDEKFSGSYIYSEIFY
jgi:NAD(P)H-flavin reductase